MTFKGPAGNSNTVRAEDPKNLEKIKVGDRVAITYTEAVGIAVEAAEVGGPCGPLAAAVAASGLHRTADAAERSPTGPRCARRPGQALPAPRGPPARSSCSPRRSPPWPSRTVRFAVPFDHFLHTDVGVSFGKLRFAQSVKHWVDDALMAIFFFVVGLEIKREVIVGELSSLRGARFRSSQRSAACWRPPSSISRSTRGAGAAGWGVPMATDIAFALGVLALLGPASRRPESVLAALAIVDDMGAIVVMRSSTPGGPRDVARVRAPPARGARRDEPPPRRGTAGRTSRSAGRCGSRSCRRASTRRSRSGRGVHVRRSPACARSSSPDLRVNSWRSRRSTCRAPHPGGRPPAGAALEIPESTLHSVAPLQRLQRALHPLSTFIVLPAFALANAGIPLPGAGPGSPVALGIVLGLVAGKPPASAGHLARGAPGVADLPGGVGWRHVAGAAALAGIGLTMSLFVADLAFESAVASAQAKSAIFAASIVAGCSAIAALRFWAPAPQRGLSWRRLPEVAHCRACGRAAGEGLRPCEKSVADDSSIPDRSADGPWPCR